MSAISRSLSTVDPDRDIAYLRAMPPPKLYDEQFPARLVAGTLARIKAVLAAGESIGSVIRAAIERELRRRERRARKERGDG